MQTKRDNERAASSLADYHVYGTELTRMDGTVGDMTGDGSDHEVCPRCGLCVTCGDCAAHGCGLVHNAEVSGVRSTSD